ncbi:hypothetical protein HKX48_002789 [Thoreauomyces humboldtii]|nr:hypothetical protein HKX48_002789 [Thoreauomyces humboldtii]
MSSEGQPVLELVSEDPLEPTNSVPRSSLKESDSNAEANVTPGLVARSVRFAPLPESHKSVSKLSTMDADAEEEPCRPNHKEPDAVPVKESEEAQIRKNPVPPPVQPIVDNDVRLPSTSTAFLPLPTPPRDGPRSAFAELLRHETSVVSDHRDQSAHLTTVPGEAGISHPKPSTPGTQITPMSLYTPESQVDSAYSYLPLTPPTITREQLVESLNTTMTGSPYSRKTSPYNREPTDVEETAFPMPPPVSLTPSGLFAEGDGEGHDEVQHELVAEKVATPAAELKPVPPVGLSDTNHFSEDEDLSSREDLNALDKDGERKRVHSALQAVQTADGWVENVAAQLHVNAVREAAEQRRAGSAKTNDLAHPPPSDIEVEVEETVPRVRSSRELSARPNSARVGHHPGRQITAVEKGRSDNLSDGALFGRANNPAPTFQKPVTPSSKLGKEANGGSTNTLGGDTKPSKYPPAAEDINWIALNLAKAREARKAAAEAKAQSGEKRPSVYAQLGEDAVLKARAVGESIIDAASIYDPSNRLSTTRSMVSRPASSSNRQRPPSARTSRPQSAQQKRTSADLWYIVRQAYLSTSTTAPSNLLKVAQAPIPYPLTLKTGFQYRYALHHRQQHVLWAGCHVKVPIHHADGRVSTGKGDGDDPHKAAEPPSTTVTSYTFVTIDRTSHVTMWDVGAGGTANVHKPRAVVKFPMEVEQMAFISKLCVYVGVGCGRGLKFFNSRFELLGVCRTLEPVLFVRYNSINGDLVTAGSHDVCVWSLEGTRLRSRHHIGFKVTPTMKYTFETGLPSDEWISEVYLDDQSCRAFAVVGTKILVYDHHYGTVLPVLRNLSTRHVKTLIQHDLYQYTIIGCADGSIQVRNMTNAIIHEFIAHTQGVTALALYPHGHVLISAALDSTLRMFCLRTFREIYCLHLRDKPLSLSIIDDQLLYIRVSYGIQVWGLNHVNSNFANINSKVTSLFRAKSPGIPPRLLTRTEDGVMRLLSPVSGKPITTMLPLLETDCVVGIAYCAKIERMYLMLESSEIYVVATNANPCIVVDIWRTTESAREDCSHIEIFDGRFSLDDEVPPGYDRATGFAVLLGTTRNGQVLVFGKRGGVVDRCQMHNAEITQLLCDQKQQLLFTCGADEMIKISTVTPASVAGVALLQIKIAISTHMLPKSIAVSKGIICASSDDFAVQMYVFDIEKKDWRMLPSHNRSDDHTDQVMAICPIRKLGLFVSCSKDGTIRVWDANNALVREIQFQEQLCHICVASSLGDLVFAFQNRLDIITYQDYLPPTYVLAAQKMDCKPVRPETPVPFDDDRTNWKSLQYRNPKKRTLAAQEHWQLFQDVNLVGTEKVQDPSTPSARLGIHSNGDRDLDLGDEDEDDADYSTLMMRITAMAVQRQEFIDATRRRMDAEMADVRRREEIMLEEVKHHLLMKQFQGRSRETFEDGEIPIDFQPTSPEPIPSPPVETAMVVERERLRNRGATESGEVGGNGEDGGQDSENPPGGTSPPSLNGPGGMVLAATILAEYSRELESKRMEAAAGIETDIARNAEAIEGDGDETEVETRRLPPRKSVARPFNPDGTRVGQVADVQVDWSINERKLRQARIRSRELKRLNAEAGMEDLSIIRAPFRRKLLRPPSAPHASPNQHPPNDPTPSDALSLMPAPRIPAPDGILPNSFVQQTVSDWKRTHTSFQITDLSLKPPTRSDRPRRNTALEEDIRKKKSEDYKAKLKVMMERMPKAEEPPEGEEGGEVVPEEEEQMMELEEEATPRARLPAAAAVKPLVKMLAPREPPKVAKRKVELPAAVEKWLEYDWCPLDEILNPADPPKPGTAPSAISTAASNRPDPSRTLKLPNADATTLLPIVLSSFRNAKTVKTRTEVVEYIQWIHDNEGIPDLAGAMKVLCRYLIGPDVDVLATDLGQEIEFRCNLIETMAKLAPTNLEVVPSLLVQSLSHHAEIRSRATQFLKALGVYAPENRFVTSAIRGIVGVDLNEPTPSDQPTSSRPGSSSKLSTSRAGSSSTHVPIPISAPFPKDSVMTGPPPDLRVAVTNFLKKSLRNYLIRATPSPEIRSQLKGLNIHGFEIKGSAKGGRGDDSDAGGGGASDSSKGKRKGGLKKNKGSRPSSAVSAISSSGRPQSGSGSSRGGNSGGGGGSVGRKKVAFTTDLATAVEEPIHLIVPSLLSDHEDGAGDAIAEAIVPPAIAVNAVGYSSGSGYGYSSESHGTLTIPSVELDMSMLMENITYRPSIQPQPSSQQQQQQEEGADASVGSLHTSFRSLLTNSIKQTQSAQQPPSPRSPITILQNPTTLDYVSALNFYMLDLQHQELRLEQEALARRQAQQEAAQIRVVEEEKRKVKMEVFARKERERIEKIEIKKRQIIEQKVSKGVKPVGSGVLVDKKPKQLSEMQTKGVGLTHRSTCHPSRETLDYDQSKFPPLSPGDYGYGHHHHHGRGGAQQMHIGKYNRSMPMERVSLLPFDTHGTGVSTMDGFTLGSVQASDDHRRSFQQQRRPSRIFSASRGPTSVPLGSLLSPAQLAPTWKEFSIEDLTSEILERELMGVVPGAELRYIRSAGIRRREDGSGSNIDLLDLDLGGGREGRTKGRRGSEEEDKKMLFRTQRKYFIPSLSYALETVAAGQTYNITD